MKRPSFQFYPADWLRDTALRCCSTGARGLWIDMICYMHEGTPYGHLKVGEKVILPSNLARMVGEPLEVVEGWLHELSTAGVFDIAEDGTVYSRRMIRDEETRQKRAEGGKLGGNPNLKNGQKDNLKVENEVKQKPTPSSSSASSSSKNKKKNEALAERPSDVSELVWISYQTVRKAKNAPLTELALLGNRREAVKAKLTLEEALTFCCETGWQAFNAEWYANRTGGQQRFANPADVARSTVPDNGAAEATKRMLEENRRNTAPPPSEVRAKIADILGHIKVKP